MLPYLALAQSRPLMTSARPAATRAESRTATEQPSPTTDLQPVEPAAPEAGGPVNTLPLFGERPKTSAQIDAEVHFLNDCDQNFTSRAEASDFFAARGWDYVASGQLDTAAYRFNLSWLLNHRNADAYWGLGVVSYQRNQLPTAIRMLKEGLAVADTNATLMTDLATVQLKHYQAKGQPDDLREAETVLLRAVAINPKAADTYQKLSLVHYLREDYDKAWAYFHQARTLDLSVLDLSYLNDLLTKSPDPQGMFK